MQNPNLDSFETRAINLLPPLRLSVWRLIFEMASSRELQSTTSELLFQISQLYLIESELGTLTSSTDLVVTQYSFMLALIEFNPTFLSAFMDLLVERLDRPLLQAPSSPHAPTRVVDSALLDELAIILDRLFFELDAMSNRLSRLEGLLGISEIMALLQSVSGSVLAQNQRLEGLTLSLQEVRETLGSFPSSSANEPVSSVCSSLTTLRSETQALPRATANLVTSEIVGESYFRWDSKVSYFPTLVLIFVDRSSESPIKRCQVKLRLTQFPSSAPFGEPELEAIVASCNFFLNGLYFMSGSLRCNYVSPHASRWKTTLWAHTIEDARRVLTAGCSLIGEAFDPQQLSVTQGRLPSNLRPQPLHVRVGRTEDFSEHHSRRMDIKKASVLINGGKKPFTVYLEPSHS